MCNHTTTLSKNCYGKLTYCSTCGTYQLNFNNIYLEFTVREIRSFKNFLNEIEIEYWDTKYDRTIVTRKIPIQTMQQNLSLVFNKQELSALKALVNQDTKKPFETLGVLDIDYIFFLN